MATSRTPFLHLVHTAFQDKLTKDFCISESIRNIKGRTPSRIFDSLPCVVDEATFQATCENFQMIIRHISVDAKKEYQITREEDKNAIKQYIQTIAIVAREDLLDEEGNIKKEIITLFDWERHAKHLRKYDIVCGYISALNSRVSSQLSSFIDEHSDEYLGCMNFVNKNNRPWVMEILQESQFWQVIDNIKSDSAELFRASKKPLATAGFWTTVTTAGGLLALGIFHFCQKGGGGAGPTLDATERLGADAVENIGNRFG